MGLLLAQISGAAYVVDADFNAAGLGIAQAVGEDASGGGVIEATAASAGNGYANARTDTATFSLRAKRHVTGLEAHSTYRLVAFDRTQSKTAINRVYEVAV